MTTETRDTLAELRRLESEATPGPWRWAGRVREPMVTTVGRGMVYVMGFARSGMRGAQPTFQVHDDPAYPLNGRMADASELVVREVPYREDIVDIDHPDARLLVAARNALPLLLDAVDALERVMSDVRTGYEVSIGATGQANRALAALTKLDNQP